MSSTAASFVPGVSPGERVEVLFGELAELTGQRNAIDGRVVEIFAELDRDGLCGSTGCRSMSAVVAWRTGVAPRNADTVVAIAQRLPQFPRLAAGMREGRFCLDQVGVIAEGAADDSDEHYAGLAAVATVTQLRTAVKLEPRPKPEPDAEPGPRPEPPRSITKTESGESTKWQITLPRVEAATFDAALSSHHEALVAQWKRDHADGVGGDRVPRLPGGVDSFMSLIEAGWDTEVAARPHGARTTVVAHLDVERHVASLHLGPLLTEEDRRFLLCDATCEVWFHRHGRVIGAGRVTRTVNRRLRRALEHRDQCCVVPGCGATRGLHAHDLTHWEDGGATELANLVLLCPFHHRLHHRGGITLTGPADQVVVTDNTGRELHPGSLARPPTHPPPAVPPCPGPTGERADWWWYTPFQPQRPPTEN